jgi:hypothetical protein
MARINPKAKYDQITWLGIATRAMAAGEFTKLTLTGVLLLSPS